MNNETKLRIFLVDDDAVFLKALEIDFRLQESFIIETYATGELCIENLIHKPDVIILDYQLDGTSKNAINGLETLDAIVAFDKDITVVMLSSQDKIEVAVNCLHHRAFDYVVKSETAFMRLQMIINKISEYKKVEKKLNWYMTKM